MNFFLQAQGFDVWKLVVEGYKAPATPLIDKYGKKLSENNSKATNYFLSGMASLVYVKFMHYDSAKDIGKNFKMFMKLIPKSKGPSFKIIEVNLSN
jgi:hypothetical protein